MCTYQHFSMVVIMQNTQKSRLTEDKVNMIKITKVRADKNKLHTGKEWRP